MTKPGVVNGPPSETVDAALESEQGGGGPEGAAESRRVRSLIRRIGVSLPLRAHRRLRRHYLIQRELDQLQRHPERFLRRRHVADLELLKLSAKDRQRVERQVSEDGECQLGEFDQDGFLKPLMPMSGLVVCSEGEFLPRKRFRLHLLATGDGLAVRKLYRGDRIAFMNELHALHRLGEAGCNVPSILGFELEGPSLLMSYVAGDVLRERLAAAGAVLRDRDLARRGLRVDRRTKARRIRDAWKVLPEVVDEPFVQGIRDQLVSAHRQRVVIHDFKYGNIIIEVTSGLPYLIDFHCSESYPRMPGWLFRQVCKKDMERFALHFAPFEAARYRRR